MIRNTSTELFQRYCSIISELADGPVNVARARGLRDEFGEVIASRLIEVARLQSKAITKFGEGTWWVTERALQQATTWQVAAIKAGWMAGNQVLDLCCGIGGDSVRLAQQCQVVGIDCDSLLVSYAAANARQLGVQQQSEFHCRDVEQESIPDRWWIHIDPDRRRGQVRTTSPDHHQPSWDVVQRLIESAAGAIVKLAPAAEVVDSTQSWHRCWISSGGSVREQSLLCGEVLQRAGVVAGARSAIKVQPEGSVLSFQSTCQEQVMVPDVTTVGEAIYDPDAAIRAAGLTEAWAADNELSTIGGPTGFLTGPLLASSAQRSLSTSGRVIWSGTADDRKLRRALRELDSWPATIKVRGLSHDPARLTRRYRRCGSHPVTLWLGRHADHAYAAITTPL